MLGKEPQSCICQSRGLRDRRARGGFNSVTHFLSMYMYKKVFEVERGRSACA